MPATFFIGDLHFGHEKVSRIRGFGNTQLHDNAIMRKWTKQVKDDDIVYILGDISSGRRDEEEEALQLLAYLPGRKRLISGNHDSVSGVHKIPSPHRKMFAQVFEKMSDFGHFSMDGRQILLSHYPYWASGDGPERFPARFEEFRLPDTGKILIHAHTHYSNPLTGSATGREICVSWDAWRRMVDQGDIYRMIAKMEATSLSDLALRIQKHKLNYVGSSIDF